MENRKTKPLPENVHHYAQLKNSEYLGSWDIPEGKSVKLTIKDIRLEEVNNPGARGKPEWKTVLLFEKTEKRMVLNVTNSKSIASWHGNDPQGWKTKPIELIRGTTSLKGETVECIRVVANDKKAVATRSSAAAQAAE